MSTRREFITLLGGAHCFVTSPVSRGEINRCSIAGHFVIYGRVLAAKLFVAICAQLGFQMLGCTTLLTHDFLQSARRLVRYIDRCLGHPSAALQDSFEIVTNQIALRSNQLLGASAVHEAVHSLHIAIQLLSAKTAQFARDALK